MRIEGTNSQHWVLVAKDGVVHHADYTRTGEVIEEIMDAHRPEYWLSDRSGAQENHGKHHQSCLAHLARDLARVLQVGDHKVATKLRKWGDAIFALSKDRASMTRGAIDDQGADLKATIDKLLKWNDPCPQTRKPVAKMCTAKDQLLTFASAPGLVEPTNNQSERALRPSVIQRKVTNGYPSKAAADTECKIKTGVDTPKLRACLKTPNFLAAGQSLHPGWLNKASTELLPFFHIVNNLFGRIRICGARRLIKIQH